MCPLFQCQGEVAHTDPGLDRTNDHVYSATTSVVRAVMEMTRGVQTCGAEVYTEFVRVSLSLSLSSSHQHLHMSHLFVKVYKFYLNYCLMPYNI